MNLFPSFGFLPKEGRPSLPSASFGKLHLWRGGGFPKEANVLREASPLAAFRRKPKEANLFPSFGFLPKEGRPSASSRRKGVLRFLRLPSESFTSGGVAASFGKLHL